MAWRLSKLFSVPTERTEDSRSSMESVCHLCLHSSGGPIPHAAFQHNPHVAQRRVHQWQHPILALAGASAEYIVEKQACTWNHPCFGFLTNFLGTGCQKHFHEQLLISLSSNSRQAQACLLLGMRGRGPSLTSMFPSTHVYIQCHSS